MKNNKRTKKINLNFDFFNEDAFLFVHGKW